MAVIILDVLAFVYAFYILDSVVDLLIFFGKVHQVLTRN